MIDENISMVFSLNDLEIGLLAELADKFERETGAVLYVPSVGTRDVCADKWQTFLFARSLGIPTPHTFLSVDAAQQAIKQDAAKSRWVVKPRWGSASIGLYIVDSAEDLPVVHETCARVVRGSALSVFGKENAVIIQEWIEGQEYGVDMLFDRYRNLAGFAAKRKLSMRAGETDKALTVSPKPFHDIVSKLAGSLSHRGNVDCDFLERDGQLYLLELNPRFGGGYPFTHMAGANHVQMLIDDYQGKALPPYGYREGMTFAKCDTLVQVPTPV